MSVEKENMKNKSYDEIAQMVNEEIWKTEQNVSFKLFRELDKKFSLPSGSAYEMSGWADALQFD